MDLGLSDAEWGRTTFRRLMEQVQRWEEVQHRADLRAGLVASLVYNANRGKKGRAMMPEDFFRSR